MGERAQEGGEERDAGSALLVAPPSEIGAIYSNKYTTITASAADADEKFRRTTVACCP